MRRLGSGRLMSGSTLRTACGPPRGPQFFVPRALGGSRFWTGSKVAYLLEALQVSDGTAHVGMLWLVWVLFQLGVEVQDRLCPLPYKPGARVRQFKAVKEQGSLHGLARVPTVSLTHPVQ
jgi:hypothetical protein